MDTCYTLTLVCFPFEIPVCCVGVPEWGFIEHLNVLFSDLPHACRGTAHNRLGIVKDGQMFGKVFEWLCTQHANNGGCLQLKQGVCNPAVHVVVSATLASSLLVSVLRSVTCDRRHCLLSVQDAPSSKMLPN